MEQIVYGGIRVQLMSEEVVRIERAGKKGFCDRDTFFIPDRAQYADSRIAWSQEENVICFGEYELYLPEGGLGLNIELNYEIPLDNMAAILDAVEKYRFYKG